MDTSVIARIERIQQRLGVTADGIIGAETLTAIERLLRSEKEQNASTVSASLQVSRAGLKQLVEHEISSESWYNRKLKHPSWPGGASGVTIGIGYDLGYNNARQVRSDWGGRISDLDLEKLLIVCGLKGAAAADAVANMKTVTVEFAAAETVFYQSTLPRYAAKTRKAYLGVELLYADAQAALLSLVYNRGVKMSGASRREMKALKACVEAQDYTAIAEEIRAMKRLWEDKGLDGLLKRRDAEARLAAKADRVYKQDELVWL